MRYCKGLCGIPTHTIDAKAHHLRRCSVNDSFEELKVDETGNHALKYHICSTNLLKTTKSFIVKNQRPAKWFSTARIMKY